MNKWLKIFVILTFIVLIAAGLVWEFVINKPFTDIEKSAPAFSLSTQEIWKQYNQSIKLSDSLYTGKVIEITGNPGKIDKVDSLVYVVFVMEPDPDFGNKTIRCEMLPKFNETSAAIPANAVIKIKGYCSGYDQTDLKLSKCSIISAKVKL